MRNSSGIYCAKKYPYKYGSVSGEERYYEICIEFVYEILVDISKNIVWKIQIMRKERLHGYYDFNNCSSI